MRAVGFIKDMVNVNRSNRLLLRGDLSAKFRNFDREAYLEGTAHFRKPLFREASQEYMQWLHEKLIQDNARIKKLKTLTLLFAITLGTLFFSLTLWGHI